MAGIYRQRNPERTVFYRVLFHYFDEFVAEYENRFEREYGYFRSVIQEVVRKQLINFTLVQKILHWRHTGFHVHSKVRATSKQEAERIGKYMIRPILSLRRLSLDEAQGQVSKITKLSTRLSLTSSSLFMPNDHLPLRSSRRSC